MTSTRKTFAFVAAALVAVSTLAGHASAQYVSDESDRSYSYGRSTPRMPAPGFEGFIGDGNNTYCSYRREPYRKCFNNRYGEEVCKTVGWRRIEHCY